MSNNEIFDAQKRKLENQNSNNVTPMPTIISDGREDSPNFDGSTPSGADITAPFGSDANLSAKAIKDKQVYESTMKQDALMRIKAQQESLGSSNSELNEIGRFYGNSRNEYINEQTANFDKAYANQVADLEKAYADAVADGKMSVRDAEREFSKQKKLLDEQSYADKEGLKVHAQQRGIQNSQQLLGLEMGASARTTSMMREGMSERDLRIADIRDRMDALSTQKKLALASAKSDRDYGVIGATSEANRMYNENMGGLLETDYFNRQGFEHDKNMQEDAQKHDETMQSNAHKFDLEKMDVNQRHVIEQMAKAHGYDLEKLTIEQANDLEKMSTQHGYDMIQINQQFQNNVSLDQLKYSHDMNMSEQEFNQAKAMAQENSKIKMKEEEDQYNRDRTRKLNELGLGEAGVDSKEFKIWDAEAKRNLAQAKKEAQEMAMVDAMIEYGGGSGSSSGGGSSGDYGFGNQRGK